MQKLFYVQWCLYPEYYDYNKWQIEYSTMLYVIVPGYMLLFRWFKQVTTFMDLKLRVNYRGNKVHD